MTVDKPPLALWVQSLSVRVFGYHSLSILVPQALMGMASVALVYDLVRRRFGRVGGFVAGLALALTPITVGDLAPQQPRRAARAVLRGGAVVRGARARGRAHALAGARGRVRRPRLRDEDGRRAVVVPGIVAAWLWIAPARAPARAAPAARGRRRDGARRRRLAALVELTPAADRPWVSGTSDNSILSLIFEYNGLGRVDGQTGGPGRRGAATCSAAPPGRCAC
jgi:hypothetical protein